MGLSEEGRPMWGGGITNPFLPINTPENVCQSPPIDGDAQEIDDSGIT